MTHSRTVASGVVLAGLTALAVILTTLLLGGESAVGQRPTPPTPTELSSDLAAAPALDLSYNRLSQVTRSEADARALAINIAPRIPLPAGADFSDIHWENADGFTAQGLETVMQLNAACKWWRLAYTPNPSPDVLTMVAQIPTWSAMRAVGFGDTAKVITGGLTRISDPAAGEARFKATCR